MTSHDLFLELRRLAAGKPRDARLRLEAIIDSDSPDLPTLLDQLGAPSESRLRQVVAHAVRGHPGRLARVPQLASWLEHETDEFTIRALRSVLDGEPIRRTASTVRARAVDGALVDAYRYTSGRLTHRVRNSLTRPQTALARLRRVIGSEASSEVRAAVDALARGFAIVSRVAEFHEGDPEYFAVRPIHLGDWLSLMNARYAEQFEAVTLTIEGDARACVVGSDFYLETAFWNVWTNAQQAVQSDCHIVVRFSTNASDVAVLIKDNGDGFPQGITETAFERQFSTKGEDRGRGLLEIQDAVERLGGSATLVTDDAHRLRLRLVLPQWREVL